MRASIFDIPEYRCTNIVTHLPYGRRFYGKLQILRKSPYAEVRFPSKITPVGFFHVRRFSIYTSAKTDENMILNAFIIVSLQRHVDINVDISVHAIDVHVVVVDQKYWCNDDVATRMEETRW